jgi:hypothetical protein
VNEDKIEDFCSSTVPVPSLDANTITMMNVLGCADSIQFHHPLLLYLFPQPLVDVPCTDYNSREGGLDVEEITTTEAENDEEEGDETWDRYCHPWNRH